MKPSLLVLACLAPLLMGGCASKLQVFSVKDSSVVQGIRVHAPVAYVITKKISTQKCPDKEEESIIHLPVGHAYDINVDPAPFAKTEFSIVLSDNGSLKQVTLNSTPQAAETIKAAGELIEKAAKAAPAFVALTDCGPVTAERIVGVKPLPLPK